MYLLLITTWTCNLRCSYCGVRKKKLFISKSYLRKSIDLLLTSKDEELKLEFFGGEPLMLPFDMIKQAIVYGDKKAALQGRKIQFIITTNGILLNKEKVRFFKEFGVLLILSLDGLRKSQNINRPQIGKRDSYSLIKKNLPLIFNQGIECFCYTVVTPETVKYFHANLVGLVKLGFKKIWLMMACGPLWTKEKIKELKTQLKQIAQVYPQLLGNREIVLLNLENWLAPFRMNTELSVNIDGFIYSACLSYLITKEEVRKKYVIGHINDKHVMIDDLEPLRLTNEEAMDVIYRENNIKQNLASNIEVGKIFTEFGERLQKSLIRDGLWDKYKELSGSE